MSVDKDMYKGYRILPMGTYPMVKVHAQGQGAVPAKLGGMYSTVPLAQKAIDFYLNTMSGRKRAAHDGKSGSKTSSKSTSK